MPAELDALFPAPLQCLFEPKRYKVLWGGRGAGRSWGVARALLLLGQAKPIRVLCARELQKSIDDSVHKLLSDQISALGLDKFYDPKVGEIRGVNGTTFAFEGIKNNVTKIKSYEGIDICWVEEAVKVSRASWGVLIPTIRKEGSEIWMSFNPELETDYTYKRWVTDDLDFKRISNKTRFAAPIEDHVEFLESSQVFTVKMTWRDNPWFPPVLKAEMEADKKRVDHQDYYLNVWEGHCLQNLEGAIYAKELRKAQEEDRVCNVGWDRETPVDTFWDLGRADNTAIWFAQKVGSQFRILAYYEASGEDITHFVRELQKRAYVYGDHWLPWEGDAKQLGSRRTIKETLSSSYPGHVHVVGKFSIIDGINAARMVFPNCWFDRARCEDGLNALRHYRYRVVDGQLVNKPLHNWASDGADAFRTMAISLKTPRPKSDFVSKFKRASSKFVNEVGSSLGWMS